MKTIFAHASGDTFELQRFEHRASPSTTVRGSKPVALVSAATRAHERLEIDTMRSPAMPAHLRDYLDWRAMVRHEVKCGRG